MAKFALCVVALAGIAVAGCHRLTADDHLQRAEKLDQQGLTAEAVIEYRAASAAAPQRGDIRMKLADAYIHAGLYAEAVGEATRASDLLPKDAAAQVKAGNILLMARDFNGAQDRAMRALALGIDNLDATLLLGNAEAGLKNFDDAIREYQDAILLKPAEAQPYVSLAAILQVTGKAKEAEANFRKAVAMAPSNPAAHLALANFLWSSGRAVEAERSVKKALELAPGDVTANRALVTFYLASNRAAEAEPYIRRLTKMADTVRANLMLADYYVQIKRYDDARKVLTTLSQRPDGRLPATVRLAAIDAEQGFRNQATQRVNQVLAEFPKDVAARLLHARLQYEDHQTDAALKETAAIVKEDPNSPLAGVAFLLMGRVSVDTDRWEQALAAYGEVLKREPRSVTALLALASLHFWAGHLPVAVGFVNQALAIDPGNVPIRALQVRVQLAQGDKAAAARTLASLKRDAPESALVQNVSAAEALASGRVADARANYARATQLDPSNVEATAGLVKLDLLSGRTRAALDRVEAQLNTKNPSPAFLVLAAETYEQAGETDKVEESLKKAIEAAPDRMAGYSMLGYFYARQHRLDAARVQFEALVKRNPSSVWAGTMLGMVLESLDQKADAEKRYQSVLALNPRAAIAANNLSYMMLTNNRDTDTALQLAQTAYRESPADSHISDTLGWAYFCKSMKTEAVRQLQDSVKLDPRNPNAQYHLGMAYAATGDTVAAKKALQKVVALKSTEQSEAAKKALAELDSGQSATIIK